MLGDKGIGIMGKYHPYSDDIMNRSQSATDKLARIKFRELTVSPMKLALQGVRDSLKNKIQHFQRIMYTVKF